MSSERSTVTASRPELCGPPPGMSSGDVELLDAALALLDRVYLVHRHEVVAALRTPAGIHLGVHVDGSARRSAVCAEGVAIGNAVAAGGPVEIEAVVSVLRRPTGTTHLIEPCGVCAELITDYSHTARVWITDGTEAVPTTAAELLPHKRTRLW